MRFASAGPAGSRTARVVRAGLCGQGLVPGGFPVPGQQLVHTGVRQLGDAGEDIGEPSLRVDVVELGGADEGVHRRGSLAAAVGAGEQPRASAQRSASGASVAAPTVDIEDRRHNPLLSLWNALAGGLVDDPDSWPESLQMLLRDFTYERLTPLPGSGQGVGELRDADWYVDWLAGDSTGSFQPYQQLARVPASYGANATARTVLVAGRERHRKALPWWSAERWVLCALRWTIGYGYGAGELRALLWALLLVLIGTAVARCHGPHLPDGERPGFWYSLDMLLPGIQLSERHAKLKLPRCPRDYFHFHRLAGYILLFFVLVGLTGLTEPAGP